MLGIIKKKGSLHYEMVSFYIPRVAVFVSFGVLDRLRDCLFIGVLQFPRNLAFFKRVFVQRKFIQQCGPQ